MRRVPLDRYDPYEQKSSDLVALISNGCFSNNIYQFDNELFGISIEEALSMSIDQRLLLQQTHLALLDAGY